MPVDEIKIRVGEEGTCFNLFQGLARQLIIYICLSNFYCYETFMRNKFHTTENENNLTTCGQKPQVLWSSQVRLKEDVA